MGKSLKQPVGLRFSAEELALLDRVAQRYGTKHAAVIAGLQALDRAGAEPSPEEALRILERVVRERRP